MSGFRFERRARAVTLGLADVAGAKGDLALKIGEIDDVEINQAESADTGGGKIQAKRRAKPPRADEQDLAFSA